MTNATAPSKILLLTVGTGNPKDLEGSLYAPLRKSIATGTWARVVFLPSQETQGHAELLAAELTIPVAIETLPHRNDENDVDRCFAHFDRVLAALKADGRTGADLVADFTRGTKAMSAALVLAGVRHDLTDLRYIEGEREGAGTIKAGTEIIRRVHPSVATARRRLDTARDLFRHGNFAAVLDLLPPPAHPLAAAWPVELRTAAAVIRPLAEFCAAWDRLNYRAAAKCAEALDASGLPADWAGLWPPAAAFAWIRALADDPGRDGAPAQRAAWTRRLVCDLLANGERCTVSARYEDAVIRAYRVLELLGQIRLFDKGLDSARLPADHPTVTDFTDYLRKKKTIGRDELAFTRNSDGTLSAARERAARLLKRMGDPLAADLLKFDQNNPQLTTRARNHSILVHGFAAVDLPDPESLRQAFQRLDALIQSDGGADAAESLRSARWLNELSGISENVGSG